MSSVAVTPAPARSHPAARRRLRIAAVVVLVGSVLPWVDTAAGNFLGVQGAGLWTLSAGGIGLAGSMLPQHRLVVAHAAVLAVVATLLSVAQVLRLVDVCSAGGCVPGVGLAVTLFGGALASSALFALLRRR